MTKQFCIACIVIFGFPPLQTAYPVLFLNHGPDLDAPSCDGGYKSVKKMYSSYCVMPYISDDNRKVNVYYPESDPTWTPEVLKALGNYNSCRWIPVDENGVHHHEWGDWEITIAGTYQQEGVKERVCTKCGEKETAKISRQVCLHKWGWGITQAQLLKEGGTKRHYTWTGFLDMIDHGHPVVRPKAFYVYI